MVDSCDIFTLQWPNNGCDGASNYWRLDYLLSRLFSRRSTRKMFPMDDVIMTHILGITSLTPKQQDFSRAIEGYLKDMDQICRRIHTTKGFFYWQEVSAIPSWTTNYTYYNVCGETIYPFPNFNAATAEVWEWVNTFIPLFIEHLITYPCWD